MMAGENNNHISQGVRGKDKDRVRITLQHGLGQVSMFTSSNKWRRLAARASTGMRLFRITLGSLMAP